MATRTRNNRIRRRLTVISVLGLSVAATAAIVNTTLEDFHLSGTQSGQVGTSVIQTSSNCTACHANYDSAHEPHFNWKGSLMGNAGRDPLFNAQLATANQDVADVGYYCMRCHMPMTFVTGHAAQADGSTLNATDRDGVTCHFCHSMVDPIYKSGISPPQDQAILNSLADVPQYYANSMFVLDPSGTRRGPYNNASLGHTTIQSPFHTTGEFCGTCHDVGNVATTKQPDGSYAYNALDQRPADENPWHQFPLERTYTEWKLSAFANGGVDMGGRFGGAGPTVVSTCQDCHMPKASAYGCNLPGAPLRPDLPVHDFAGASAWVLDIIGIYYAANPNISLAALAAGRQKAVSMLQRAATLEVSQQASVLHVRVINESGHKIPTGHIEGRRIWPSVQFFDANSSLVGERGHYDVATAELDESTTRIYEMRIGLSPAAALATGLPAGETLHMSLADTITKDSRIPPRGFNNAAYEAGGAPAVGIAFVDGQYWDDLYFGIPPTAVRAEVTLNYQTVTKHYIEGLKNGNSTNHWGDTLYNLWLQTNKNAPIGMSSVHRSLAPFDPADIDGDGDRDVTDWSAFVSALIGSAADPADVAAADLNLDGQTDGGDVSVYVALLVS